jgi:hypothetical protein
MLDMGVGMTQKRSVRILRWLLGGLAAVIAVVVLLDTFGGYVLDGPLGPIPGGALQGPVSADTHPQWADVEKVIELEIRPERPWSLSVWNVVLDGELYVPSARGAHRRWTAVAVKEPLVRLRSHGQIHALRIERVTDPTLRQRLAQALAQRYGFEPPADPEHDATWYFHLTPRT